MIYQYNLPKGVSGGGGSWYGLCARWAPTIKRWSPNARNEDHNQPPR